MMEKYNGLRGLNIDTCSKESEKCRTSNHEKCRRHTVAGLSQKNLELKLKKYQLLLEEESNIRKQLHRAESEIELSLPLSSETVRNFYQSSISQLRRQRSLSDMRNLHFVRETYFLGQPEDRKKQPTKSLKHDFPRRKEERREHANEKAMRRKASINSLDQDLIKAEELLGKYKQLLLGNNKSNEKGQVLV